MDDRGQWQSAAAAQDENIDEIDKTYIYSWKIIKVKTECKFSDVYFTLKK